MTLNEIFSLYFFNEITQSIDDVQNASNSYGTCDDNDCFSKTE